jgi:hypothetical protein
MLLSGLIAPLLPACVFHRFSVLIIAPGSLKPTCFLETSTPNSVIASAFYPMKSVRFAPKRCAACSVFGVRFTPFSCASCSVLCNTCTIRNGLREMTNHLDQRDLNFFQIGLRFIEWCIVNRNSFHNYIMSLSMNTNCQEA